MSWLNRAKLLPKIFRGIRQRWGVRGVIVFSLLLLLMTLFALIKASQAFLPFTYIAV